MDRKSKGRLGEVKVLAYFIEHGYEVYLPYSDGSKYDILVLKEGKIFRVSVKYTSTKTSYGKYRVNLSQSSRRNNGKMHTIGFDRTNTDLLAVYIHPEDRVEVLPVDSFTGIWEVNIK